MDNPTPQAVTPTTPPLGALFPNLQKRNQERVKKILLAEGHTEAEINDALAEAAGEHPFLDMFVTYALPILLALLKNLILAKKAAGG